MSESRGRTPPHNIEAEQGLLGSCLVDAAGGQFLSECMEAGFQPQTFYQPAHQVIYQILVDLHKAGKATDEVTLIDALGSRSIASIDWLKAQQRLSDPDQPLLELIGGHEVVFQLTQRIETTAHASHWREIVREKWMLRRIIDTTGRISSEAYRQPPEVDAFIDAAEHDILALNDKQSESTTQKFDRAIQHAVELLQNTLEGKIDEGVRTGYKDLDKLTFGLHGGEMIVLAARPSMGKTSLGMNIAENVALPRRKDLPQIGVLVFSLEMPTQQLSLRMLCGRASVNMTRVRERMVGAEEQGKLARAASDLQSAPIWVDDATGLNILQLRAKARRIHRQHDVGLIVVDYLQLISGTDQRVPREQQISEISRGIKGMAKELNVPVLVLSQLNRSSEKENRQPRISDLRESGSIEQDADVVFLLATRQSGTGDEGPSIPQAARERNLIIAKQRNGPTGEVPLTFIPEFTRFENHTSQREP
jgi:replicative DNA helicase